LARVRRAVVDCFGVELALEVHLVGVFIDEEPQRN
jgi:chloramphenicol 3-O-phosphotransferase